MEICEEPPEIFGIFLA